MSWVDEFSGRTRADKPWKEYPIGTKAWSVGGGYWERTELGWKWCTGSTFPTPGADAFDVTLPEKEEKVI